MSSPARKRSGLPGAGRQVVLAEDNQKYIRYIREKTNQLLEVMGTECLRTEELDDGALIELDPIGIIADSFAQVLDFLKENISELQQARDELQAIFDATGVGISIIDRDFAVQRCNEKQRQLLVDQELGDVAGHSCYEIYCAKDSPGFDCPAVDTFATGRPVIVRDVKKKDKYFQVVTTPYAKNAEGEVTMVIEVSMDITEKKMAEEAEKKQREYYLTEKSKLATVIESLSEGLLVLDPEDLVVAYNRAAGEITGRPENEMLGQPLAAMFPKAGPLLSGGGEDLQGMEIPYYSPNKGELQLAVNAGRLQDGEGVVIGRLVTFRDITEEKKRLELYHRTEKLAAIGQLSAGVAHELNTPLGSILGYAMLLLKESELSSAQKERLAIIIEQAKKSSTIIKALLNFARHSSHTQPTLHDCDLNGVVDKALRVLSTELVNRNIELAAELQSLPLVVADSGELEQVVLNLVLNALQAIRQGGRIAVRTSFEASRVVLAVEDNGPGIPEEIRSRIFDPFFTTKPIGEGTGLGLSVCSGIISDIGGTMEVTATPGGGATFIVSLPAKLDALFYRAEARD
jgi:PAS domain S-box-containing protein